MNKIVYLDEEIILKPEDSKTNVYLPFSVESDLSEIVFDIEYHPKIFLDKEKTIEKIMECIKRYDLSPENDLYGHTLDTFKLSNLVTFSLDINNVYKGCAHRHAKKQVLYINNASASPGFYPGSLHKGKWTAVICVYEILTDKCIYKIRAVGTPAKGDFT